VIFNTHQITADILKSYTDPNEIIAFSIKGDNVHKFLEGMNKLNYNLDYRDKKGNSFLTLAVLSNSVEMTEYLLDLGSDPNIQNVHKF
jgi:ankyrin repeat protein